MDISATVWYVPVRGVNLPDAELRELKVWSMSASYPSGHTEFEYQLPSGAKIADLDNYMDNPLVLKNKRVKTVRVESLYSEKGETDAV